MRATGPGSLGAPPNQKRQEEATLGSAGSATCLPYPVLPLMMAVNSQCPVPQHLQRVLAVESQWLQTLYTLYRPKAAFTDLEPTKGQQLTLKGCEDLALMRQPISLPEAAR